MSVLVNKDTRLVVQGICLEVPVVFTQVNASSTEQMLWLE